MIPTNTWEQAALTKEEKEQIKTNHGPISCENQIEEANINTWTRPSGKIQRQIDYIMINANYRNAVTKTWADHGWGGKNGTTTTACNNKNGHSPTTS